MEKKLTVDLPADVQLNDNEHLDKAPAIFRNAEILHLPIENIPLEYGDQWPFPKDEHLSKSLPIQLMRR
jgi:hypothetical protein